MKLFTKFPRISPLCIVATALASVWPISAGAQVPKTMAEVPVYAGSPPRQPVPWSVRQLRPGPRSVAP